MYPNSRISGFQPTHITHTPQKSDVDEITNVRDNTQAKVQPSKAVIMMSSGGTIKNEETGNVTAFFVRQSPNETSLDIEDGRKDPSLPWAATRSTPPLSYFRDRKALNSIYKNMEEYRASPEYKEANEKPLPQINMPGMASRAVGLVTGKMKGTVPGGWAYENKQEKDGTYSITPSRLFVSVKPKKVSGTDVSLPTREIELYELSREASKAETEMPEDVANIQVFLPESKGIVPIGKAGSVIKKPTVNCHELGEKYLLYRTDNSVVENTDQVSSGKRKLLIFSHGNNWPRGVDLKEGVKISFFAPNGNILFSLLTPLLLPLEATYSTHEKMKSRGLFSSSGVDVKIKGESKMFEKDGTTGSKVHDVLLSKMGSPIHDNANSKSGKVSSIMQNTNEGAAWTAVDKGIDVVLVRQQTAHPITGYGSLKGLMAELEKNGLGEEYDEILVHACRGENKRSPVYGVANNLSPEDEKG